MNTAGICSRFAVVRIEDAEPIDGAIYRDISKAGVRAKRCHDPCRFAVREVVIMTPALATELIDFYTRNKKD